MPMNQFPRRQFLTTLTVAAAASCVPRTLQAVPALLYPPMDLSRFNTPIPPAESAIHFGYAAITWNGNDRQAIEDISALGFPGIQLRSNCIAEFNNDPAALKDLLAQHNLTFVAFSSGSLNVDKPEPQQIALHTEHAKFLKAAGGMYLQVVDERPKDRAIVPADQKKLGGMLTELGKRIADLGIALGYHNHMGSLGEHPEELDRILEATDPRYAKLELDVAHYYQGGGDPAKASEKHHDRLLFLHIKDVDPASGSASHPNSTFHFIELGRGKVDLPAVFAALKKVNFRGWAIVELDEVAESTRTPKDSGEINKKYLHDKLGITIGA
jgi:inosose dehydratase